MKRNCLLIRLLLRRLVRQKKIIAKYEKDEVERNLSQLIYTNSYGSKFFFGCDFWYVRKKELEIVKGHHRMTPQDKPLFYYGESFKCTEVLTYKESLDYIETHKK